VRVIIAGSRTFGPRREEVLTAIDAVRPAAISEVVSGCAPGVDKIGEEWAANHGIHVRRFPADWDTNGKAAGPIRNREMARYAEVLILVWDGTSHGSADMKRVAQKVGLRICEKILEAPPVDPNAWRDLRKKARTK